MFIHCEILDLRERELVMYFVLVFRNMQCYIEKGVEITGDVSHQAAMVRN